MSRVKAFRTIQVNQQNNQDNNDQNNQNQQQSNQDQNNNQVIVESPIPEGVAIIQDQQFAVEGQIVEEGNNNNNRPQRRRQGRIKDLPINQIEIDIEIQNEQEEIVQNVSQNQEKQGDLSNINIAITHKEEIFVSQDHVIRAATLTNNQTQVVNTQLEASFTTKSKIKSNYQIKSTTQIAMNNQQKATNIQIPDQQQEVDIPQGIPINDVRRKLKSLQDDRNNKISKEKEQQQQISNYHPLKSFSEQLRYVPVSVRVIIFFSNIALYEWMCIASYLKVKIIDFEDEEQPDETESFASTVVKSIVLKNVMQYFMPFACFLLAHLEKLITNKSIIFEGNTLKYIFLTILSVFAIFRIDKIASYLTNSQVNSFISILCTSIGIDLIIIDCLYLYSLTITKRCQYLIKLVMLKNFDYKV